MNVYFFIDIDLTKYSKLQILLPRSHSPKNITLCALGLIYVIHRLITLPLSVKLLLLGRYQLETYYIIILYTTQRHHIKPEIISGCSTLYKYFTNHVTCTLITPLINLSRYYQLL